MAKDPHHRTDIHTVAKRAGVSIATVSRVVNRVGTVNRAMAARVHKAIAQLDYSPNTHARSLVSGRSRIIGLIVTLITNPFYPELIQNFETLAAERGYDVLIGSTNYRPERKLDCLRRMEERKVDGVAMMTFGADEELLRALAKRRLRVVSIGASGLRGVQPVHIDFNRGIHEAVQHLAVLGHRKMAFISGPLRVDNSLARQQAFFDAMRSIGARVPKGYVFEGDHSMESGFRGAERMLALAERPTAILCSNDLTAIGALHAVSDRKLRVPKDISIVGFDDIQMAQFTVPPLTSVRMSAESIARVALATLIPMIEGGDPPQPEVVTTQLIVRQSTGYAPSASSPKISRQSKRK
jgi:DNA-binding LacI/PurR family transcriptional regulator